MHRPQGGSIGPCWIRLVFVSMAMGWTGCPPTAVDPCLTQVSSDGFGNAHNRYAWAMRTFGEHLYVGTMNAITADGDPGESTVVRPSADRDLTSEGTEIWRYDGSGWSRVVAAGFGDVGNNGTRNLAVLGTSLYAGTVNPTTGAEVWRSGDGLAWSQINEDGFGSLANEAIRGMATWRDQLWVGTLNEQGAEVWSHDGAGWTRAATSGIDDPMNDAVAVLYPYLDRLYAGTWNDGGARLYRFDGTSWTSIVGGTAATPAGFGDPNTAGIMSIVDFRGALYASTRNFKTGFSVWRSLDEGGTWEAVATKGINDARQPYGWVMHVHDDQLFLGTWIQGIGPNMYQLGGQLYRTANGTTWIEEVGTVGTLAPPGIGDNLNYGIRTLETFHGNLHIGTAQCFFCSFPVTGLEVWERDGATCPG